MTTTSGTTTGPSPIDDLKAPGQAVGDAADTQAADAVSTLGLIQQARLANQRRTATLAIATYGKESTQAAAAAQAVTATTAASARLAILNQQVATPAPTVAATGWALHGRIYSSDLAPQASYAVFLVDAQKNYLSDYGFAYTDATGYFLLSYDGGSTTGQKSAAGAAADAPAGQPASAQPAAGTPAASSPVQLFLQVADANANPVLLSETAFAPVVGKATYQAVTLPAGAAKLGNPPAELRSVALPPIAAKTKASATPKPTNSTPEKPTNPPPGKPTKS
jgi:hypothetical protein